MPLVSILMPVYNAARYLRPAVESMLRQTLTDFELIAVDDGSTDASRAILEDYARGDARVRVISRPNTGIVGALNDAIRAARAPYLARMDADDISFPHRLERQVRFLETHPEVVLLGSAVVVMDSAGRNVKRVPRPQTHVQIENDLLRGDGGALIHPAVMMRASACRAVGNYRPETQFTEDLDLFLRLAHFGRVANLGEPLLRYRMHAGSVNFTRLENKQRIKQQILAYAYSQRQLPLEPGTLPPLDESWRDYSRLHRDWAVSALELGSPVTSLAHAWQAVWKRSGDRQSWKTLSYVLRRALRQRPHWRQQSRVRRFWAQQRAEEATLTRLIGGLPVVRNQGRLLLGDEVQIDSRVFPVRLSVYRDGLLTIGGGTYINRGTNIAASARVSIGAYCQIGEWVTVLDTDFHPVHQDASVRHAPVAIGDNVWLGNRTIVLPGVEIGEHSVVGAGAVVTRSLPPRTIAAGNPARIIGEVNCDDSFRRGYDPRLV